jgi:hypothetical protein
MLHFVLAFILLSGQVGILGCSLRLSIQYTEYKEERLSNHHSHCISCFDSHAGFSGGIAGVLFGWYGSLLVQLFREISNVDSVAYAGIAKPGIRLWAGRLSLTKLFQALETIETNPMR